MNTEIFKSAIELFDAANQQDPNRELWQGKRYSKEYLYAMRMTQTMQSFAPQASEALQLSARCQHICRWEIPRDTYEMDRTGYLLWRKDLKKFHTNKAAEILSSVGYSSEIIDKVSFLLLKKQLKKNADTQLLEDVICLVFLEFYFESFAKKYKEEKLIDIIRKTWKKMSEKGHKAALEISYAPSSLALIQKALTT